MLDRSMDRREALRITAFAGVSVALGGGLTSGILRQARLRRVSETRGHMGTLVTITVVHPHADEARHMVAAAFEEMGRLEAVFSRHRSDTPVGRLNRTGRLEAAPPELLEVLGRAEHYARLSEGAFDVTVAPLLELYERSFRDGGIVPPDAEIEAARRIVDYRAVRLDRDSVVLEDARMSITLDGIAKGYIVDRTIDVLVSAGSERVLVNAGGDMATGGRGSLKEPWTIGIQDPHNPTDYVGLVRLGGECIATSGDYMGSFTEDRRFHHIIDPRTGRSPEESSSVSVVAATAMDADALSTALLVLGPTAGIAMLEDVPGSEGVIVTKDATRVQSSGLRRYAVLAGLVGLLAVPGAPAALRAQRSDTLASPRADTLPLFASHDPLDVTLIADFSALRRDRRTSPDRAALARVPTLDGGRADVGAELRTRGAFRLDRSNCAFPPLRIDVDGSDARGTVFEGQDELKIVASCRPGRDSYQQLVLTEYLAYRSFGIVTGQSFRVRLLRLTLVDTHGDAEGETRTAFVIEDAEALAERLGATVFDLEEGKNLPPAGFDPMSATTAAVFQYMIGNPDWSDVAGHNVEILDRGGSALSVPYDFDFSGIVDAPYATPPPDFGRDSVRDRYYRGWCANPIVTRLVLDRFREARGEIMAVWNTFAGLSDETRRRTVRYLEEFFDAIETGERAQRRFLRDCRPLPN